MDPAFNAAEMGGLLRRAIGLVRGVQICLTGDAFKISVISVFPLLKVTEQCDFIPHI
jgi:hypothetical protein